MRKNFRVWLANELASHDYEVDVCCQAHHLMMLMMLMVKVLVGVTMIYHFI